MQSKPTPAAPAEQPNTPKLCAYAACGREFVPTNGRQNYCKPECRRKARNALALEKYHKKRQLSEKQREEAVQIALQNVHECEKCREVLDQLFRSTPSAIERYHRDVKAALADPTIAIQAEKPCECCHLAPVVGTHGNCKLCIPCAIVRADESQRENSRRHRANLRGDAPVEEVMLCIDCGKEVEPNPRTGKIDRRRLRCLECTEANERDLKNDWKKNKSAEERAKADQVCQGLKIEDEWIRQCGLSFVPQKTLLQKYCTTECEVLTNSILAILDPEVRKRRRDNATKNRKLAKLAIQLEPKLAEAEAAVEAAEAEVDRLAEEYAQAKAKLEAANAKWSDVGRTAEDEVWAIVDGLYSQHLKWDAIKAQADKATGFSRTVKAYQEGRKRYLARQKPTK